MRALHDSFVLFPGAEPTTVGHRVSANTRRLHSVQLWGPLHALWADRFTRGLSHLGISILNGFARQEASGSWGAEFLVMPMPGGANPETLDYMALTEALPPPDAPSLLLDAFHIDNSPERGGFVYLEVRGPDRVGFLGSLLRILGEHGLVPREMWVATATARPATASCSRRPTAARRPTRLATRWSWPSIPIVSRTRLCRPEAEAPPCRRPEPCVAPARVAWNP